MAEFAVVGWENRGVSADTHCCHVIAQRSSDFSAFTLIARSDQALQSCILNGLFRKKSKEVDSQECKHGDLLLAGQSLLGLFLPDCQFLDEVVGSNVTEELWNVQLPSKYTLLFPSNAWTILKGYGLRRHCE